MRFIFTFKNLLSFLFAVGLTLTISAQSFNPDYQDGKIYFKYNDSEAIKFQVNSDGSVPVSSIPELSALLNEFTVLSTKRPFDFNNDPKLLRTIEVQIAEFNRIEDFISRLSQNPTLEYVEKVPLYKVDYLPNDSLYNLYNGPSNWNWHLELIQGEQAWDLTTGDPNINVAIVDNAVWVDHPDLSEKVVAQRDMATGNNNANPPESGDPDLWSHGTHVAGLVGASSNNNIGVASIGYNVSLIAVKAAYSDPESITYAFSGVQWAAANGADIINMSWGGAGFSQTNQNLINSVASQGIVLIAAAGNENTGSPHYPSAYENVISVASVDWNDVKSDFSNFSTTVDISAPGGIGNPGPLGLLSTTFSNNTLGYYDAYEGTSMACPVVSGVAGLILSVNPELTPAEVEEILKSTSDDISALNPDFQTTLGAGRVNAYHAVLNTPYTPTAQFSTPVEIITPGTSIDFVDHSTGVPSTWQWSFEGGSPATSTDTMPSGITYNAPGTYNVSLTVTNDFGTSSVTYNDFINVVTNPSPYVFVSVSNNSPCIGETVQLTDSSLYAPTSWEWAIEPETYEYLNGSTSASQNPEVQFLAQGLYNITLTAYNGNGMTSKLYENAVNVQGVAPNYILNMEEGTSEYFVLWDTVKSQSAVDHHAANNSTYGIHFHGDPVPTGWAGSASGGTPEQAWNENLAFQSEAHLCGVDARNLTNLKLAFDLRQTYSVGPRFSWFRVLVNGNPVASWDGTVNYNPATATQDPWKRVVYDLTPFAGQVFDITLQACNRFSYKGQGEGDNVYIDNVEITINVPVTEINKQEKEILVYPNPSAGDVTIDLTGVSDGSALEITNAQGKMVYHTTILNESNNLKLSGDMLTPGLYFIKITDKQTVSVGKLLITKK
ncbi:MAG TPA: S8 family serine peptidase [Lentimicrobium sp.]|nr:S8 family serine peptidase [Lentimicrobium sp.]